MNNRLSDHQINISASATLVDNTLKFPGWDYKVKNEILNADKISKIINTFFKESIN